ANHASGAASTTRVNETTRAHDTTRANHTDAATRVAAIASREASPMPAAAHSDHAASSDAVIAALLEGLGVDSRRIGHPVPPALARLTGTLLREALQGTMHALRARSAAKGETHVAMTMIDTRHNNPLKFFPDAEGALTQMLSSDGAAWLGPRDAVRE